MKFMIDTARNMAYKGKNCYHVGYDKVGLYVEKGLKKIYLESSNTKTMEM